MRRVAITLGIIAALTLSLGLARAQEDKKDKKGPRTGAFAGGKDDKEKKGPRFGGGGPPRAGQILPPFARERLKLTDDQEKQLDELQKEIDARLSKILTDEQEKSLRQPPMGLGGFGGGIAAFGGGGFGGIGKKPGEPDKGPGQPGAGPRGPQPSVTINIFVTPEGASVRGGPQGRPGFPGGFPGARGKGPGDGRKKDSKDDKD